MEGTWLFSQDYKGNDSSHSCPLEQVIMHVHDDSATHLQYFIKRKNITKIAQSLNVKCCLKIRSKILQPEFVHFKLKNIQGFFVEKMVMSENGGDE